MVTGRSRHPFDRPTLERSDGIGFARESGEIGRSNSRRFLVTTAISGTGGIDTAVSLLPVLRCVRSQLCLAAGESSPCRRATKTTHQGGLVGFVVVGQTLVVSATGVSGSPGSRQPLFLLSF